MVPRTVHPRMANINPARGDLTTINNVFPVYFRATQKSTTGTMTQTSLFENTRFITFEKAPRKRRGCKVFHATLLCDLLS
jgi:hypothetical protein